MSSYMYLSYTVVASGLTPVQLCFRRDCVSGVLHLPRRLCHLVCNLHETSLGSYFGKNPFDFRPPLE